MTAKADYKKGIISQFGTGASKFCLDDLVLKPGDTLPENFKGKELYIRKLSGKECMTLLAEWSSLKKDVAPDASDAVDLTDERYMSVQSKLVAKCLTDDANNLLWDSPEECNQELSFEFLQVAFLACQQVNGLGGKAQEEAEKNS